VLSGLVFDAASTTRWRYLAWMAGMLDNLEGLLSVAKGPKFRPHNSKGAAIKAEGLEKLATKFLIDLHKKGPNFFKTLVPWIICGSSEMNKFLTQLYPYILLQFFSFWLIISSRKQVFHVGRIIFLAAEFL
jgi:hypothetical protein